jgi:periplasmic divalent cation tolerance protein
MYSLVYVTTPNRLEAERITYRLLEKKLIACGNIFPIHSIYRWQNKIERSEEFAIILKTQTKHIANVIKDIKEHHPYDVPCIIATKITEGNKDFLNWIKTETEPTSEP